LLSESERKKEVQNVIKVKSEDISIYVWDDEMVDGDTISLYLNNQLIIDRKKIRTKKLKLNVSIKEGKNELRLFAHNLGSTPPNTAAILIEDEDGEQLVHLNSDLLTSGVIEINFELPNEDIE
jgi:hypothetical protein